MADEFGLTLAEFPVFHVLNQLADKVGLGEEKALLTITSFRPNIFLDPQPGEMQGETYERAKAAQPILKGLPDGQNKYTVSLDVGEGATLSEEAKALFASIGAAIDAQGLAAAHSEADHIESYTFSSRDDVEAVLKRANQTFAIETLEQRVFDLSVHLGTQSDKNCITLGVVPPESANQEAEFCIMPGKAGMNYTGEANALILQLRRAAAELGVSHKTYGDDAPDIVFTSAEDAQKVLDFTLRRVQMDGPMAGLQGRIDESPDNSISL